MSSAGDFGATWLWTGHAWEVRTTATVPSASDDQTGLGQDHLGYDAATGRVVLVGTPGALEYQACSAETWTFDGTDWQLNTRQPNFQPPWQPWLTNRRPDMSLQCCHRGRRSTTRAEASHVRWAAEKRERCRHQAHGGGLDRLGSRSAQGPSRAVRPSARSRTASCRACRKSPAPPCSRAASTKRSGRGPGPDGPKRPAPLAHHRQPGSTCKAPMATESCSLVDRISQRSEHL